MFEKYGLKNNGIVKLYWLAARIAAALAILPIVLFVVLFTLNVIFYFATGEHSMFTEAFSWGCALLILFGIVVVPLSFIGLAGSTILFLPYYYHIRSKAMVASLLNDLKNGDATVRKSAISEVGNNRIFIAEGDLTTMMLSDPDIDVGMDAYLTLDRMGRPKLEYLLQSIKSEKEEIRRLRGLGLLRRIGDSRQIPVLVDVYWQESGLAVKKEILYSLNAFKSDFLKAFFVKVVQDENDGDLRALAVGVLLKYDDPALAMPLNEALREGKNKGCRPEIIKILGKYKDRTSVEPLIEVMLRDENTAVRLAAMNVLDDIEDVRSIGPLKSLLQDPNRAIRDAAAESLHRQNAMPLTSGKEIVREIVKLPCAYCGTLIEVTDKYCYSCGAPFKV